MSAQFHMLSQSLSSKRMLASLPCKRMFANIHLPTSLEFSRISSCPCNRTPEVRGKIRSTHALPDLKDSLWEDIPTPVLDKIDNPANLKYLTPKELKQLAADIRSELCLMMPRMQNHLKASLTCVELTIAVHYVFKAPVDKILWDSDNQNYTHMLLTGRRSFVDTVSSSNGIPISTSPGNNEYDQFGSAHGCSSISVGLGMAVARDIKGKRERVVTVINNESTMAGQVYEAMSSAGYLDSNLIVILNDTSHSLHRKPDEGSGTPINVLSSTFGKLQASKSFRKMRELAKAVVKKIGKGMHEWAAKVDEYARGMMGPTGSTLFEELGLYYIGPIDGHNIEDLICVLQEVASLDSMGPVLVHVLTNEKKEAVASPTTNLKEKIIEGCVDSLPSAIHLQTYGDCFVEALSIQVQKDKDIVAVYAGMGMDPSLGQFHKRFPDRFFDVGMAEQHAVTFSAGLARGGLKPFCIIPSAFLKRSYDQVVHDVDHQKIPVRFAIPSAGLTGPFDEAFMSCMPNMIVMAPSDETELASMVALSAQVDDRPICFRYPSTVVAGMFKSSESTMPIEIGKGRILVEGKDVALLGYGSMVQNCLSARSLLSELGVDVTVADARFCKPLDINLVRELCKNHAFLITVEEGSIGGFGSHVAHFTALDGGLDGKVKWRPVVLPDTYIEKASRKEQLALAGLTGHHIAATALSLLGRTRDALLLMC